MIPYDDPDELAAHLRDDGTLRCSEPGCDMASDGTCDLCGAELCKAGLYMHEVMGCKVAREIQAASVEA